MKDLRNEDGQVIVVVVLAMGLLLAFIAVAFDVGEFLYVKRQLQTAADAAALAGALEVAACGSTAHCSTMTTAAKQALSENNLGNPTLVTQCASNPSTWTGLTLEVNNGPCLLGSTAKDPNFGSTGYVETVVSYPQPTILAKLFGVNSVTLSARSEAGGGTPASCLDVLGSGQSVTVNGGGAITVSGCAMTVNSTGPTAMMVNGNVSAQAVKVGGGSSAVTINGGASVSPNATTGTVTDPLLYLQSEEPSTSPCGATTSTPYTGSPSAGITLNSGQNATLNPGVYCGTIQFNGNNNITLNPGMYVFTGNVLANSGVSLSGNGVTLYFSSGTLTMNSGSSANMVAPTSTANGGITGILMFQNQNDSNTMILDGNSSTVWQGAVYLPDAQLDLNGGSNLAAYTVLVVKNLMVNAPFTLNSNFSSLSSPPIPSSSTTIVE